MTTPVRTRSYRSPRRQEQAAATRRSVLRAARDLFTRDGYAATTVTAIAAAAGVSLDTVYASVGRKPELRPRGHRPGAGQLGRAGGPRGARVRQGTSAGPGQHARRSRSTPPRSVASCPRSRRCRTPCGARPRATRPARRSGRGCSSAGRPTSCCWPRTCAPPASCAPTSPTRRWPTSSGPPTRSSTTCCWPAAAGRPSATRGCWPTCGAGRCSSGSPVTPTAPPGLTTA